MTGHVETEAAMLIVTGYIHLAPSDVEEFVADMATFARTTRAGEGCLFYAVAPDDPGTGRSSSWSDGGIRLRSTRILPPATRRPSWSGGRAA